MPFSARCLWRLAASGLFRCRFWPARGGPKAGFSAHIYQGPRMKAQTARTGGRFFFYWPVLRVSSGLIECAKPIEDLTVKKKLFRDQRINALQRPYKMVPKKSCRISIPRTPIDWTSPRVGQIRSQIKKLVFLKIEFLGLGCFLSAVSSWGLDMPGQSGTK